MYGERIKKLRESLKLSRPEFAESIGSTVTNIYQWEEELLEPTITDLIIMAAKYATSVDWLVGAVDDYEDDDYEDDESNCDECEDFIICKLIPHMETFFKNNEDDAYIHIQLTVDSDDNDNCIIYSGRGPAILSAINILIKSLADKSNIGYHDLVDMMIDSFDNTDWEDSLENE